MFLGKCTIASNYRGGDVPWIVAPLPATPSSGPSPGWVQLSSRATLWTSYSTADGSGCTVVAEGYGPIIPFGSYFGLCLRVPVASDPTTQGQTPMVFSVPEAASGQLTGIDPYDDPPSPYPVGVMPFSTMGGAAVILVVGTADFLHVITPVQVRIVTPGLSAIQAAGGCRGGNFTSVDLAGADLSGLDFTGANFTDAVLDDADLSHANLTSATLTCASLRSVTLSATTLYGADLSGCDLSGATAPSGLPVMSHPGTTTNPADAANATMNLQAATVPTALLGNDWSGFLLAGAVLLKPNPDSPLSLPGLLAVNCDLSGAMALAGADLTAADFSGATLRGAALNNITAPWSSFAGAILEADPSSSEDVPAQMAAAYLPNCNLSGAHLNGVDLSHAHLYGATTEQAPPNAPSTQATLQNATLQGTNFTGANLGSMNFQGCMFEGAIFDAANLINATFAEVTITRGPPPDNAETSFVGASLQGADLSSATLVAANFTNACIAQNPGQLQITRLGDDNTLQKVVLDYGATKLQISSPGCSCPDGTASPCGAAAMVAPAPPAPPLCVPDPQQWCPNPNTESGMTTPTGSDLAAAASQRRKALLATLGRQASIGGETMNSGPVADPDTALAEVVGGPRQSSSGVP